MKKIAFIILLTLALSSFYLINQLNYKKIRIIKRNTVEHPENLPTKEVAKNTSFGFENLKADLYWLETIQYIGGNAVSSEYKKYLFSILEIVTELNPYFDHPYIIGQLLLPDYNERYEKLTTEEINTYTQQAIKLGKKGIKNFCTAVYKDKNTPEILKTKLIEKEFNLKKIWTEKKYKNPCKKYNIPDKLAYIYYFSKKDGITASKYYKIASANDDSLKGTRIMAAIMQGKGGNREKSFFMFINMAQSENTNKNEVCSAFSEYLLNFTTKNYKLNISTKAVKEIQKNRKKFLEKKEDSDKKNALESIGCINYLNKATREINLHYIEKAYKKYLADGNKKNINSPEELKEKGYLDFIPTDYQQSKDSGIQYYYNKDTKFFDYEMGYSK